MGSEFVVIHDPFIGCSLHFCQCVEQIGIQDFFPVALVESLNKCILIWFARLNEAQLDFILFSPVKKYLCRELGSIV